MMNMDDLRTSLIFSTDQWPPEGFDFDFELSPEILAPHLCGPDHELPVLSAAPMTGHLEMGLIGERLRLKGRFSATVEETCDRCLILADVIIGEEINEVLALRRGQAAQSKASQESGDDEGGEGELAVTDGRFDLTPLMAELFWLAWPFQIICRPDCRGLCPNCGADLNEGLCVCQVQNETIN